MSGIGIGEIAVILVIALLVFGPDRLPTMIKQAASFISDLRKMVANARRDLSESVSDLGIDEKDLKTLTDLRNPKSFLRQKVLDGVDLNALGLDEIKEVGEEFELSGDTKRRRANGTGSAANRAATNGSPTAGRPGARTQAARPTAKADDTASNSSAADVPSASPSGARFDPDAT